MKMRMKSLGKKSPPRPQNKAIDVVREDPFPNVRLSSHKLADVKNLKVGDKCQLMFDAEVTGTRKKDDYERHLPEGTVHADFKLHKGMIHSSGSKSSGKGPKTSEAAYNEGIEDLKDHEAHRRLSSKMK